MSRYWALFLDGPIAGEVMSMPDTAPEVWELALPPRVTLCACGVGSEDFEYSAERKMYYAVSHGEHHVLYSEHKSDDDAILFALKRWRVSDFSAPAWHTNCRSRRAFA